MVSQIYADFADYITHYTHSFVGREWVFDKIYAWLANPDGARYFLVIGEPGIGKTAIAARLTEVQAVSAYHFCNRRRTETVDPLRFTHSLVHQLTEDDDFARTFLEKCNVNIEASQNIKANFGKAININIENLTINAQSTIVAFSRIINDTLRDLSNRAPEEQLVIVVDGLDEAVHYDGRDTIVDLLATCNTLPSQVRFVLTTRPDANVLRCFDQLDVQTLRIEPGQKQNLEDIRQYVSLRLASLLPDSVESEMETFSTQLAYRLVEASQGNFLYLSWVFQTFSTTSLSSSEVFAIPNGLAAAYREFLRRRVGKDLDRWREMYRPVLAILAVARAPLNPDFMLRFSGLDPQQLNDVFIDIEQFLDDTQWEHRRYQLYHSSVADFFQNKAQSNEFWIDTRPVHRQIATDYYSRFRDHWESCDEYGLMYLPVHLLLAGEVVVLKTLLFDFGWMKAKLYCAGIHDLVADYELLPDDEAVVYLRDVLRLSVSALQRDPNQLGSQLVGRIQQHDLDGISDLLDQVERMQREAWLRPAVSSLQPPGGPLLLTLRGHKHRVNALAVTVDGKHVVSGSRDSDLRVWDIRRGTALQVLAGHTHDVDAVCFSPSGKFLVSGSRDNNLKLWNPDTGLELGTLVGHSGWVRTAVITMDNQFVVSGGADATIKIWEIEGRRLVATLHGHTSDVTSLVLTKDGRYLISGSFDNTLRKWDLANYSHVKTVEAHYSGINDMAMIPNSLRFVTASSDASLKIWDVRNLTVVHMLLGHARDVSAVTVTSDGQMIISGSWDQSLRLWNAATGDEIGHISDAHGSGIVALAVTPDGRNLVTGSHDNTLRVWNLNTMTEKAQANVDKYTKVLALSSEDSMLVTSASDHSLQVWDLRKMVVVSRLRGHTDLVEHAVITEDDRYIISGARDHSVRVWDAQSGAEVRRLTGHSAWIKSLRLIPDQHLLVSVAGDTVRVWNWQTAELIASFSGDSFLNDCIVSSDSSTIVVGGGLGELHFLRLNKH